MHKLKPDPDSQQPMQQPTPCQCNTFNTSIVTIYGELSVEKLTVGTWALAEDSGGNLVAASTTTQQTLSGLVVEGSLAATTVSASKKVSAPKVSAKTSLAAPQLCVSGAGAGVGCITALPYFVVEIKNATLPYPMSLSCSAGSLLRGVKVVQARPPRWGYPTDCKCSDGTKNCSVWEQPTGAPLSCETSNIYGPCCKYTTTRHLDGVTVTARNMGPGGKCFPFPDQPNCDPSGELILTCQSIAVS
jgi:hypothetical protein